MSVIEIVPITQGHIEGFHKTLDIVARERRYLSFLEAPPFEATRAFILDKIEHGHPQLVVLSAGEVVGWCDVTPKPRPIYAHSGVLGMGLLPQFRDQGIGKRLIVQALAAARAIGLQRVELTVRENNTERDRALQEGRLRDRRRATQRRSGRWDYENLILMAVLF